MTNILVRRSSPGLFTNGEKKPGRSTMPGLYNSFSKSFLEQSFLFLKQFDQPGIVVREERANINDQYPCPA